MPAPRAIAPDLTVRQVANAWPACAPVLGRCPGAKWGGRWSLQELAPFARACGLDEGGFLRELAEAANVPIERRSKPAPEGSPLPLIFTAIAIGLTLGAGWGVMLLLRIAFGVTYAAAPAASVHVHGVAQLWGWMSLFIFAVATHLLRQNSKRPAPGWMRNAAAGAVIAALLAFFAGLVDPVRRAVPAIDVIASALLTLAAVGFGLSAIWSIRGRGQKPQLWHGFVFAMTGWLWAWAMSDLLLRLRYENLPVLPDAARGLLILLPVLGFATNAIYGFGIRLIPGLLNLSRLRPRCFALTLALHNTGLVLLLTAPRALRIAGAALLLSGCATYLRGLDLLRSKPSRPIYGVDPRGHVLIRVAFFWLAAGLAMILLQQVLPDLPHAYSGAWRHALTVGFITTMILGVGQRVVPVFIKQPLASTGLMLASAVLIIVGNAGRVTLELATMGHRAWAVRLMGVTGVLELAALLLFGLNVAATARRRRRVYAAGDPLTADTRVREAVNVRPELQQRLRDAGVTMLDEAGFIAPSLTFGAMALAWGRQPRDLLAEITAPADAVVAPVPAALTDPWELPMGKPSHRR
jgi:hypothetical protein